MGRIPSMWELVDSQFPDSQSLQTKISLPKRESARVGNYSRSHASTPTPQPFRDIPYITQMPKIMRPYIENIMNVKGDGNCEFRVIARHVSMDEENHVLVRSALIHDMKNNKSAYLSIFGLEGRFQYTLNG